VALSLIYVVHITSASVTVKNDNETFYVAITNEKVQVYSYEADTQTALA